MSAPDARDVIAATINDEGWTCEAHEPDQFGECQQCHATQLRTAQAALDALTETGFVVVRLPEPSTDSWGDPEWIVPHTANRPGRVRIDSDGRFSALGCPNPSPSPADAEALAAALLAAAAYAKAGEGRG